MKYRTALLLGTLVRLTIAPFFAHPRDVYTWFSLGMQAIHNSSNFLSMLSPYDFAMIFFAVPASLAYNALGRFIPTFTFSTSSLPSDLSLGPRFAFVPVVPGLLFDILVKIPLILSDLLIALLLFRFVKLLKGNEKSAVTVMSLWFLNPFVIWISSGWGMFDTLPTLLTILSLYLVVKNKFELSGVSLVVAIMMKYYSLFLVIPLLIISWKFGGRRGLSKTTIGIVLASVVLIGFSFMLAGTTTQTFTSLGETSQNLLHYSGLTFWTSITIFYDFNQDILSDFLIGATMTLSYLILLRLTRTTTMLPVISFAIPLGFLLVFYSFIGENFLIWLLPFLAIISLENKRILYLLVCLSTVALVSSVSNSLLPYYLFPVAPWFGNQLASMLALASPYKVAPAGQILTGLSLGKLYLATIGAAASAMLLICVITILEEAGSINLPLPFHRKRTKEIER